MEGSDNRKAKGSDSGALSRDQVVTAVLFSVMTALGVVLFHFQGNSTDVQSFGRSALVWMVRKWSEAGGTMSHGWIIPVVSLYLVWRSRREIALAEKHVSRIGLAIVILSLVLHWLGIRAQQSRFALFSLIGLLWGIPFYLYGRNVARLTMFPCAYLLFCVPWNFLEGLTFPLRLFASAVSAVILNGLGIETVRVGTALHGAGAWGFHLDVADPCSGLRSLMAITALTAVYAQLTQRGAGRKWILFLCSVPLAMIGNIARIVIVAVVSAGFSQEFARTLSHDYSGYLVFVVAVLLMLGLGSLLNVDFLSRWREWKQRVTGRK